MSRRGSEAPCAGLGLGKARKSRCLDLTTHHHILSSAVGSDPAYNPLCRVAPPLTKGSVMKRKMIVIEHGKTVEKYVDLGKGRALPNHGTGAARGKTSPKRAIA